MSASQLVVFAKPTPEPKANERRNEIKFTEHRYKIKNK
jgi:hypothetical protein